MDLLVLVTLAFCLIEGEVAAAAARPRRNAPKNREMKFTPVLLLTECARWHETSGKDVAEQALHREMCGVHVAPAAPPPPAAVVKDREGVKAISEAVLEVLPTSQQNFALDHDGAKVLASNPGAKKVAAILDDDGDTFMRNDCRDDKWVVLELSQVAKVSRIELGQHELYSSRVKEFEVRGRQSHPRTDNVETAKGLNSTAWRVLGKFTAEKAKGVQQFAFGQPAWVRYLLLRLLTHYGTEPVCAINGVAVYGKSAAEELEDQLADDELGLEMEPGLLEETLAAVDIHSESAADAIERGGGGPQGQAAEQQQQQQQQQQTTSAGSGSPAAEERPPAVPEAGAGSGDGGSGGQGKSGKGAGTSSGAASGASTGGMKQQEVHGPASATPATAPKPAPRPTPSLAPVPPAQRPAEDAKSPPGGLSSSENRAASNVSPLPPPIEALPTVKGKSGGGIFDVLVQEILTVKAQQRMATKALESLQRNLTSVAAAAGPAGPRSENSDFASLEAKLDALVATKLQAMEAQVERLQVALERAAKREHAVLCLLGMLGGVLALTLPIRILGSGKWQGARVAVGVLAAANGVVSLALAARGSAAAHGAMGPAHLVGGSPAAPPLPQP